MQQISTQTIWYLSIGVQQKTSLCSQFCRQYNFIHLVNPNVQQLPKYLQSNVIVQLPISQISHLHSLRPNINLLLIGSTSNQQQKKLVTSYSQIGRLKHSQSIKYNDVRKCILPTLIFLLSPINTGQIANKLSDRLCGWKIDSLKQNANQYVQNGANFINTIVSGCFTNLGQIIVLQQYFNIKIVHIKYNRIDLQQHSQFFDKQYPLVLQIQKKPFYIQITNFQNPLPSITSALSSKLVYLALPKQNNQQIQKVIDQYCQKTGALHLNLQRVRNFMTQNGKCRNGQCTRDQNLKALSILIFKAMHLHSQILISSYPNNINQYKLVQTNIKKFSKYVDFQQTKIDFQYNPKLYSLQNHTYIKFNKNISLFEQLNPNTQYWIISGAQGCGKSTVAKILSNQLGFKVIQFQTYMPTLLQKLANPQESQQVPLSKIILHFKQLFENDKDSTYVLDGFPYQKNQFEQWLKILPSPKVLHLQVQINQQIIRIRKKEQADITAQIGQQQIQKSKQSTNKSNQWLAQLSQSSMIFKLDYNAPQLVLQKDIIRIAGRRVYLVQSNNKLIFHTLAHKYNMSFFNLLHNPLRSLPPLIKKLRNRDVILFNYGHQKKRIPSQDLYWIQRNIGQVRYICIFNDQVKQVVQQKMQLVKPQPPVKQKVQGQQGAQGEQQKQQQQPVPQPQQQEQQGAKKKIDIYAFQWTKPTCYKNISQWFFKLKKNIQQNNIQINQIQQNFDNVIKLFDKDPLANVYVKIAK